MTEDLHLLYRSSSLSSVVIIIIIFILVWWYVHCFLAGGKRCVKTSRAHRHPFTVLAWVGHCPFIVQGQVHHGDRPEVLGATCMFYQFDLCLELLTYDYGQVYMYYNNNICVICDKFVISLSVYGWQVGQSPSDFCVLKLKVDSSVSLDSSLSLVRISNCLKS